jgi:hypothetical protein
MAALKFKQNDEGEDIKEAVGMYSKEKEYVNFDKICDCHGQVKIRCRFFLHIQERPNPLTLDYAYIITQLRWPSG